MRRRYLNQQRAETPPAPQKTLAEQYEEKFGKPPHHRMKDETIRKALEDVE